MTVRVVMYSTKVCPYCMMAERLLKSRGVSDIEKILVDGDDNLRAEMIEKTGRRTVPQMIYLILPQSTVSRSWQATRVLIQ